MTEINWHERASKTTFSVKNIVNGEQSDAQGDQLITKYAPYDGTLLYEFGVGTSGDVDSAVKSAREAFSDGRWSLLPPSQRQSVLRKLADLVEENREEFALYESVDVGKPITYALHDDVVRTAAGLRSAADGMEYLFQASGVSGGDVAYNHIRPIGVVAGIVGWNYPLTLAASKLGPALATGNSLVIKPSEFTSLSAVRLAELALEAGVPPGVFNVVHGNGTTVGNALAQHGDVDMITFTGSSATGKQIMIAAGQSNMKRVHLECGGKSPFLVFDDCPADLDWLAQNIVATAFPNQGALCVSSTRLLLQSGIRDVLMPKVLEHTAKIKPEHPLDTATTFGAIMNEAHMNKVLGFLEQGSTQGASLLCGGERVKTDTGGFFLTPAVFDNVNPEQSIAQEEVFGPLLSVFSFKSDDHALQLANDSTFGLAAYVATENLSRAHRIAQEIRTGLVIVHGNSESEGGFVNLAVEPQRQSGMGAEGGLAGLEAYCMKTAIHLMI